MHFAGGLAAILLAGYPCAFALNPALDVSQYAHGAWRIREGFSRGHITSIAQTPDGYLWLATDFGLSRFDGVNNVPWQPPQDQHLPSTAITHLISARDGTLWIGTRNGLASVKTGKVTQYPDLSGMDIHALLEDHEGTIWVGGYGIPNGKLCEIQKGAVRCHGEIGGLSTGVSGLHEDAMGNLWLGMVTGVWRWKPGTPEFYAVTGEPDGVKGMADGENGGLLISAIGAVKRLIDGRARVAYPFPPTVQGVAATRMLRDRDGALWVGTSTRGLVHIHQGRTDLFSRSDGLTGESVSALFEDREGNIWIATASGLDRFRELPVITYSEQQGISSRPSGAVLAARDGSIWFGSRDGVNRLNHGQITAYRPRGTQPMAGLHEVAGSGLPDRYAGSLFEDSRGRIWISTLKGAGYLENDRYISTAVPSQAVTTIAGDASGNLWIADQHLGLFRMLPGGEVQQTPWITFGHREFAVNLVPDPAQGGLWLGFFQGGLAYFRDGAVRASYSSGDGLGGGRVSFLRFDSAGALWAATEGGLSRLKNGRIVTLTSRNGLPCDAVHWMVEDDAQSVWLNMPCGLVRVARSELDAWAAAVDPARRTIHTAVFDSVDGVESYTTAGGYNPPVAKSGDGRLWFLNVNGIGVIDPGHLPVNKLPPPVEVQQVVADRKTYPPDAGLRLPSLTRDLEIDYTALSFVAPEKMRFRYKLDGHDRDWQDAGNRRQAFYNDLRPRSYRFRVAASNNSGVWNEAGAFLDFSVAPAYYQTAWFQALCAAAFLGLLWGLYQLRIRQLAWRFNMRMEERVSERTRIARDLHDTMLQSFQGVLMKLSVVAGKIHDPPEAREQLETIVEQARQAVIEGRDAVQGLRSSAVLTNELAQAIRSLGDELAADPKGPQGPQFHVYAGGATRELAPIVRDEVYRIACEAVRNAFRHAQATRIEVEIQYAERQFRLSVRDNGKGMDSTILEAGMRAGHHGLPGMQERAGLAGGKLAILSRPGAGTEAELTIPAAAAYPKANTPGRPQSAGR